MSCEGLSNRVVLGKEDVFFVSLVQSAHISCFVRLVFEKMLSFFYLDFSAHEWEAGLVAGGLIRLHAVYLFYRNKSEACLFIPEWV